MRCVVYEGVVTALTSIAHNGGESFGTTAKLRREKFVQPDESVEEVPVVSGNSLRGRIRDLGMWQMCMSLGYHVERDGGVPDLPLPAFYFLFSGGSLTSTGRERLDIDYARKLGALIPLVGVYGGAVGNVMIPGRLRVGKLIPIVAETRHLLPERFRDRANASVSEYVQEEMYTRRDDEKDEHLRQLIAPAARALLDDPGTRSTALADARGETAMQMMYHIETLCAGTRFFWRVQLDDVTDVEFDAFATALVEFSRRPYVGGRSAAGLGEVAVSFDQWLEIDSRATTNGKAVARPVGTTYAEHLRERRMEIRSLLEAMA